MSKKAEDSKIEQFYKLRPEHLNGTGRLFGGQLMAWIDEVASLVGMRHSEGNVITASVDNLKFIRGAYQNDLIVVIGYITYTGNTSMEVRVDTYIEDLDGTRRPINRAFVSLVAVDEVGKPKVIPELEVETEAQQAEWEGALRRKNMRNRRHEEGF